MSLGSKSDKTDPTLPPSEKVKDVSNQAAMAMELPFVLVAAVVVGGLIGYFLDRWLHSKPWLLILFGGIGFYAGVRDLLRRLSGSGDGTKRG